MSEWKIEDRMVYTERDCDWLGKPVKENDYWFGVYNTNESDHTVSLKAQEIARKLNCFDEMYEMLEGVLSEMHVLINEVNSQRVSLINSQTETEPDYHDQESLHIIQVLLAKARGE